MNTENVILDSKPMASDNTNDPTYPGPDGKMFLFKRNLALYLAQTKLPTQSSLRPRELCQPGPCFATTIQDGERKSRPTATPSDKEDTKATNKVCDECRTLVVVVL
jgi:hypothetical protein